jgi:hypothetical protein
VLLPDLRDRRYTGADRVASSDEEDWEIAYLRLQPAGERWCDAKSPVHYP